MKYNLLKLVTNTQEQYSATITTYESEESAAVGYHNTLAAFHNASDVLVATVKIVDEYGHKVKDYEEVVDHRPEPEPEES